MNPAIEKALFFFGGAIVGSVGMYFYSKQKMEAEYQTNLEEMEKFYESRQKHLEEKKKKEVKTSSVSVEEKTEYKKLIDDLRYSTNSFDDPDLNEHMAERESPVEEESIHMIDAIDFNEDYPNYDKITVTYYDKDHIWADDHEEVIDDVIATFGRKDFVPTNPEEDPDIMYIRNHNRSCDFEVCRVYGSYAEDVLGLSKEDIL